jgi:hypothetical protein
VKVTILAIAITIVMVTPVYAQQQWCPPWMWGCYQQQYQDPYQAPRRSEHRTHRSVTHYPKHTEHHDPKPSHNDDLKSKPVPVHTRTVTVTRPVKTWKDMNQDDAREFIKEQAQSFCGKYPKDEACVRKE